jgi:hypothetical protein
MARLPHKTIAKPEEGEGKIKTNIKSKSKK